MGVTSEFDLHQSILALSTNLLLSSLVGVSYTIAGKLTAIMHPCHNSPLVN